MPWDTSIENRRRNHRILIWPWIGQIVTTCTLVTFAALPTGVAATPLTTKESGTSVILRLDGTERITETYGRAGVDRFLTIALEEGSTVDGNGAVHFGATSPTADGSKYFGVMISLPEPFDLTDCRLLFQARTNHPSATAMFYVRAYNRGEEKPAWSFNSSNAQLIQPWREFSLQSGQSLSGLRWEPEVVEDRVATAIDRFEFIVGTREDNVPIDILLDSVRIAARMASIKDLKMSLATTTDTVLVQDGRSAATILHPDSTSGREAAAAVAASIVKRTGVTPPVRVGTDADRIPEGATILLGNVNNNPALLLYARYLTPADSVCPGTGGALVHTICDPFGGGANVIVAAASDDTGLVRAARVMVDAIEQQPESGTLVLPRLFEKHYSRAFLERFRWAGNAPASDRLERGLKQGQNALDRGTHKSIAGVLASVAQRYMLTGHGVEAQLFVKLWDLYAESAQADPREYGGPWGFDSDFASAQTVAGWDLIEDDPALSDDERLRTTKNMGRLIRDCNPSSA